VSSSHAADHSSQLDAGSAPKCAASEAQIRSRWPLRRTVHNRRGGSKPSSVLLGLRWRARNRFSPGTTPAWKVPRTVLVSTHRAVARRREIRR
jgi:hypothetical protein